MNLSSKTILARKQFQEANSVEHLFKESLYRDFLRAGKELLSHPGKMIWNFIFTMTDVNVELPISVNDKHSILMHIVWEEIDVLILHPKIQKVQKI